MSQFMTAKVIFASHQMLTQQFFNETGVMTCINQESLNDVGRALNNINVKEFEEAMENTELITNTNIQEILKLITTKNKSLGHTSKAAKDE